MKTFLCICGLTSNTKDKANTSSIETLKPLLQVCDRDVFGRNQPCNYEGTSLRKSSRINKKVNLFWKFRNIRNEMQKLKFFCLDHSCTSLTFLIEAVVEYTNHIVITIKQKFK